MLSAFFQRKVIEHRSDPRFAKTNRGKSLCKDQQECCSSQWRNEILFESDRRGRGEILFSSIWRSVSLTQQISTEQMSIACVNTRFHSSTRFFSSIDGQKNQSVTEFRHDETCAKSHPTEDIVCFVLSMSTGSMDTVIFIDGYLNECTHC
jgi:hypothetical protein